MTTLIIVIGFIIYLYWAQTHGEDREAKQILKDERFDAYDAHKKKQTQFQASATFGIIGAIAGSFIGIAGMGSAIAGTVPCAIIGYLFGYVMHSEKNQ